jgi:hypothetical protein
MKSTQEFNIVSAFKIYKDVIFNVDIDLNFWTSFLSTSIENYQKDEKVSRIIYEAVFCTYDHDINIKEGYLKGYNTTREIYTRDLKTERINFFSWIRNLSIIKSYTALEILLIQALWLTFYPELNNPTNSKKDADYIQEKVKKSLRLVGLAINTKNNKHLLEFLKMSNPEFSIFLERTIRIDSKTTWSNFFEMLSTLRNIIAHHGTLVSVDAHNSLKSLSKDIFESHFEVITDLNYQSHLYPKEEHFSAFISYINEFAVNAIKFISKEKNLGFLNMY